MDRKNFTVASDNNLSATNRKKKLNNIKKVKTIGGIKTFAPDTPSKRQTVLVDKTGLFAGRPYKGLVKKVSSANGRNNHGHITSRHRGGGHKIAYREIDVLRNTDGVEATVERLEYDPNRTAFIALIKYSDGKYSYIFAPQDLKVGDKIVSGKAVDARPGNCMEIGNIPTGVMVHCLELRPGGGGVLCRSAGTSAVITGRDGAYVIVRLASGEIRRFNAKCRATVGVLSNPNHINVVKGKAGRNRWLGKRPSVRGVAMNPIDHPHGGGEGKTSGGRHPVTPWGKSTKGKKTRNVRKTNKMIIRSRRKR